VTRPVLSVIVLLCATSAHAQVYKCVEAGGKIVYSQNPCPANSKSATINRTVPVAPPAPVSAGDAGKGAAAKAATPKTPAEEEQAFRKRQQEQQEAQKKAAEKTAEAKQKEENCRRAREQLAQLEAGGRITRFNEKGEKSYLDDDQVNQEKARARSLSGQWCN